jgi:hypothetical protein
MAFRIIFADPDLYQFQTNDKVDKLYLFPENFNMLAQNTENHDNFDTDEKGKKTL